MAIGYQITQNGINGRAATLAVRLRDLAADTANFYAAVHPLSLTTVGFTSADATAMTNAIGEMLTLHDYYNGTTIVGAFNFDTYLAVLRGLGAPG